MGIPRAYSFDIEARVVQLTGLPGSDVQKRMLLRVGS
jgi:hypothetical protein